MALSGACALKLPVTRRSAVFGATLALSSQPAFAKGEAVRAAAAAREAAEAAANLPMNKLKRARELLGTEVDGYLYEQQWDLLRNAFESPPLADVRALTGPIPAANGMFKAPAGATVEVSADVAALRTSYLDSVYAIETFAYEQQKNSPVLRGCSMVREPKGPAPSCFVNIDAPQAELKKAAATLDKILALAV